MSRTSAKAVTATRGGRKAIRKIKPKRPKAVGYSDHVPADRLTRVMAFALDGLLLHGAVLLLGLPLPVIGSLAFSLVYFATHDSALGSGRSLGRAAVKQRLMGQDGEEIGHLKGAARNATRWLLWIAVIPFFIDLCFVLFGNGRLIADYIFDTRVWEDPEAVRRRIGDQTAADKARLELEREALLEMAREQGLVEEAQAELEHFGDETDVVADAELAAFEEKLKEAESATEDLRTGAPALEPSEVVEDEVVEDDLVEDEVAEVAGGRRSRG